MSNITFSISFDLNNLLNVISKLASSERGLLFKRVNQAVEDGADMLMHYWAEEATIALPGSKGSILTGYSKNRLTGHI